MPLVAYFGRHTLQMAKAPLATSTLCLLLEFDLTPVENWKSLPDRDHAAAAVLAADTSKLRPSEWVTARVTVVDGPASLAVAQSLPFHTFHNDPKKPIRLEFVYSRDMPQLTIRVLTHLPTVTGSPPPAWPSTR